MKTSAEKVIIYYYLLLRYPLDLSPHDYATVERVGDKLEVTGLSQLAQL